MVAWSHTRSYTSRKRNKTGNSRTKKLSVKFSSTDMSNQIMITQRRAGTSSRSLTFWWGRLVACRVFSSCLCGRQQRLPRRKYGEGLFSKSSDDSTEAICGYDFCHITSQRFSVSTKMYVVCLHVVNCRCAGEEEKFISNLHVETLHAAWTSFLFKLNIYLCTLKKCWFYLFLFLIWELKGQSSEQIFAFYWAIITP